MDLFLIMFVLGFVNLGLVLFQVFTGMGAFKLPVSIHKISGIILACTATIHGVIAMYFYL